MGAFFVKKRGYMGTRKTKIIYCPSCNRRAFEVYADGEMVVKRKCDKCNKLVLYKPGSGVKLTSLPERHCSSGLTFY